jgi:hypothetical protein
VNITTWLQMSNRVIKALAYDGKGNILTPKSFIVLCSGLRQKKRTCLAVKGTVDDQCSLINTSPMSTRIILNVEINQ